MSDKSPESKRRAQRRRARLYPPKPKRFATPRGEKRDAERIGAGVAKIGTGEVEDKKKPAH